MTVKMILTNRNGGEYVNGRTYPVEKKVLLARKYINMYQASYPEKPSISAFARESGVGWWMGNKIVKELEGGGIVDPSNGKKIGSTRTVGDQLDPEDEALILSLHAEDPARPNRSYIQELHQQNGVLVSTQFISKWFEKRFNKKGRFVKPNMVPLDKFRYENILKYVEFKLDVEALCDHTRYNFIDEKHLNNDEIYSKKIRANPINGCKVGIPVSGNFRERDVNLIAAITANQNKEEPCAFMIGKQSGTSEVFMAFIQHLIESGWLGHNEVLVMDNCSIHSQASSKDIEEVLWNTVVHDRPLQCVVLWLPTRSPELNPIELVFHILARRIRDFKYLEINDGSETIQDRAITVLENLSFKTIIDCIVHCGY